MPWEWKSSRQAGCLAWVLFLASVWWSPVARAGEQATLFVYLEVPADYSVPTEISLAELLLHGAGDPVGLAPRQRRLVAADLAGQQILLAVATLAAGHYDSLSVVLGGVTARSGAATVRPPVAPDGETFPVPVDLRRDEAAVISLVWQPGPVPAAGHKYRLALHAATRPVPPLGALAFVTERESGTVLVVDRLAGRVVDAVGVGPEPGEIIYSSARQKLYVAEADADGIGVIDALTLRLERIVPLSFGDDPDRLALSPDQRTLYVLNPGSRSLVALTTSSMQEQYRTTVGDGPRDLALDPDNGNVFVACEFEGEVQVFTPAGLTRRSSLVMTPTPVAVAVAANTRQLYIASASRNRIQGLDLQDGRDLGGQTLCGPASYLVFSPRSRQLFAALPSCSEIALLRPVDGFEFAPFGLPSAPAYLTFDPACRQLLVVLPQSATLVILEANRGTLQSTVELGGRPYAVVAP